MKISKLTTVIQLIVATAGSFTVIHQHCVTGSFTILFGGFAIVICSIMALAELDELFSKALKKKQKRKCPIPGDKAQRKAKYESIW